MDGLEFSEIYYSKIIDTENATRRFDAEYFQKKYLACFDLLKAKNSVELSSKFKVGGGKRLPLNATFSSSGYKYARAEDVKGMFLNIDTSPYISPKTHEMLKNYLTKKEDVILTIVGNSIGDVAINKQTEIINLTENCVRVYSSDKQTSLLYCFLKSKYGQLQIEREKVGTAQPKLAIERIRKFLVINSFSSTMIDSINQFIQTSWEKQLHSKQAYQSAEINLRNCLRFDLICNEFLSIKTLSDSFGKSGRLDAEYYQPKYDALFNILSKHKTMSLGGSQGLVSIKKSIEPGSEAYLEEGIPFIRVSDVDKYEISTPPIMLSKDIVPNIEDLYPKKDTILLSKDGSIGIAYKLAKDMEAVTSGALLHLTVKDSNVVLPDYLTLVLNSPIVQLQAERDCNGAIIQHWKPSDIEKVLIPILDMSVQQEIASKVQESFRLRAESKRLLNLAVQAVEMAIESDEESALLWLESQK